MARLSTLRSIADEMCFYLSCMKRSFRKGKWMGWGCCDTTFTIFQRLSPRRKLFVGRSSFSACTDSGGNFHRRRAKRVNSIKFASVGENDVDFSALRFTSLRVELASFHRISLLHFPSFFYDMALCHGEIQFPFRERLLSMPKLLSELWRRAKIRNTNEKFSTNKFPPLLVNTALKRIFSSFYESFGKKFFLCRNIQFVFMHCYRNIKFILQQKKNLLKAFEVVKRESRGEITSWNINYFHFNPHNTF